MLLDSVFLFALFVSRQIPIGRIVYVYGLILFTFDYILFKLHDNYQIIIASLL